MLNQEFARMLKLRITGITISQDFLCFHGDRCSVANALLVYAMHINSTAQIRISEAKKCGLQMKKIAHKGYNRPEYNLHPGN